MLRFQKKNLNYIFTRFEDKCFINGNENYKFDETKADFVSRGKVFKASDPTAFFVEKGVYKACKIL
jgi:hypothetical protein